MIRKKLSLFLQCLICLALLLIQASVNSRGFDASGGGYGAGSSELPRDSPPTPSGGGAYAAGHSELLEDYPNTGRYGAGGGAGSSELPGYFLPPPPPLSGGGGHPGGRYGAGHSGLVGDSPPAPSGARRSHP